jgi:hypothetical protein
MYITYMKALIEKTSDLYLRRLAKEVKTAASIKGAYYHGTKVFSARFSNSKVMIKTTGQVTADWTEASDVDGFQDGYGSQIVASRRAI